MVVKQTLARIYSENIDSTVDFYEKLLNKKCMLRFSYNEI